MKRSFCALFLSAVIVITAGPALPQAAREATIEPETKARIVLQSQLNSKLNEVGDTITAVLYEPIYVNGLLVLPRGTEFHGRVTSVTPARRGQKSALMTIVFERIAMPWGEEPVAVQVTAIDDWDNDKKLKADAEGKVKGGHRGKKTVENLETAGTIGGTAAGSVVLIGLGSGGGAGVLVAGGMIMAGSLLAGLMLTKGGEVKVSPGAMFRIKFVKPMTLPVIAQPGTGPRPIQQEDPKTEPAPEAVKKP